ncbi:MULTISPECIES: ribonuclease T2 [Rhodomicrobium]|uniref:ribonuclease T2 n=1 Tax=Rhodomicrobium TaxID=1068 RepID=UPI001FD8B579|nr:MULTISPECIES: ribonuclease T2 [Rhodomicrobium]
MTFMGRLLAALLALIVLAPADARAQDKNVPGEFDYYALVLNWSPSYCATRAANPRPGEPQCSGERPYSFILHGLWPQYERGWPGDCRLPQRPWVPNELIDKMLDIMPSKRLVIHEYRKHGTCSGLPPQEYFGTARRLFDSIKIPARFQNPDGSLTISPGEVENEFLKANPQLTADMMSVSCRDRRLGDLRICFSRDLKPRACGVNERQDKLCNSPTVVMPPVRRGASNGSERNEGQGGNRSYRQDRNDDNGGDDNDDYESNDRY